ncbi:hypothetical protein [Streptomyces sp. ISL-11]|uniref:hypothetical protein n=1 Tax=Streptomyces sp. ISL-11 TaxID=2819174 RepID=UPI001BE9373E|nr:hypothetical protein [Streptomyces sp. ISL-11]MBT2383878.1 hypothetical protein [Streptomyces sp. ISL-11]
MSDTQAATESASAKPAGTPELASPEAEIHSWQSRYESLSQELNTFRQSSAADTEAAVEAARQEARTAALTEVNSQLVHAELRAHAAAAGVELPGADFLRLDAFVGEDGAPDTARIGSFVSSLPAAKAAPAFAQGLGLGRQGGPAASQLGRDDLSRMSTAEINEARKAGKLNALLFNA